ncbi:MAG: protein kinase [Deltaproteobacteria bacterium]|nr:protein kinase [Deltaproteobacteria bacterium]
MFRSTQRTTGREWALKLQWVSRTPDLTLLALQREARLMARVSHPNVVTLFDSGAMPYGRNQNHPRDGYIVWLGMELLQSSTLLQRVCGPFNTADAPDRLSEEDAIQALLLAVSGLGAVQEKDIVHLDFKPGNIFVPKRGPIHADSQVKLGDLGLGHPAGSTRTLFGHTKGFSDPRQKNQWRREERRVVRAWDFYSVGRTLQFLITPEEFLEPDIPRPVPGVLPPHPCLLSLVKKWTGAGRDRIRSAGKLQDALAAYHDAIASGTARLWQVPSAGVQETHVSARIPQGRSIRNLQGDQQIRFGTFPLNCRFITKERDHTAGDHVQDPKIMCRYYPSKVDASEPTTRISRHLIPITSRAGMAAKALWKGEFRKRRSFELRIYLWRSSAILAGPAFSLYPEIIAPRKEGKKKGEREEEPIILGRDFVDQVGIARSGDHWMVFPKLRESGDAGPPGGMPPQETGFCPDTEVGVRVERQEDPGPDQGPDDPATSMTARPEV